MRLWLIFMATFMVVIAGGNDGGANCHTIRNQTPSNAVWLLASYAAVNGANANKEMEKLGSSDYNFNIRVCTEFVQVLEDEIDFYTGLKLIRSGNVDRLRFIQSISGTH